MLRTIRLKKHLIFKYGIRDDRQKLYKFLNEYKEFWISFNGQHYDNIVLAYGQMNRWWPNLTVEDTCLKLKLFSDELIKCEEEQYYQKFGKYRNYFKWIDLDLFRYWSKLLRKSKKVSLKGLAIQLNYPVVQELPYSPNLILTENQWKEVMEYNLIHDLGILDLLTVTMNQEILLRQQIVQQTKLNAWSWDAPKIASEILLQSYCNKTGQNSNDVRKLRFEKESVRLGDLFTDLNLQFETKMFQDVYDKLCNSYNTFSHDFIVFQNQGNMKISMGVGGLHSVNNNEVYESDDEYCIITSDVAGMYPQNILNYDLFRFPEVNEVYGEIRNKRLTESKPGLREAKKLGNKEQEQYWKIQDAFFKLILNGTSGLLDQEYSWLYNPTGALKLRLIGQLTLNKLIELCTLNNFRVVSANTDGVEVILKRSELPKYYDLIKQVEEQFRVEFEHDFYKKIVYQNVNSYIAITESGHIKKKGQFVTKPELTNSVDFLVIPKLLQCYFVDNIRPEYILKNLDSFEYNWDGKLSKLHIYDFNSSQKVDRSYKVEWKGIIQQRLNRYFVSKNGAYLYKVRGNSKNHLLKGWGVQLYNRHEDKSLSEYNLDIKFYLQAINKIISEIERNQQLTLF